MTGDGACAAPVLRAAGRSMDGLAARFNRKFEGVIPMIA